MAVSAGAVVGIVIGVLAALALLFGLIFWLLRWYIRGPTKGSDIQKKLDGKVVAITGANTGIGKETALDLAKRGAKVILLCRNVDKGQKAAKEIRETTGSTVEVMALDLSSLKSVRECAQKLLDSEDKLDVLINNAGVMACPYEKTEDGFEMQLGTNHLGHFLLTELLRPLLLKCSASGSHPRVVIVSSMAHHIGTINWEDLHYQKTPYSRYRAYGQSKLANILHAKELARRLENTGITVYVLHPGVIHTELSRHADSCLERLYYTCCAPLIKTPFYGAQTTLYCALADQVECQSGLYYSDCAEKTPSYKAQIKEDAKKLWEVSEALVGLK